MQTIRDELFKMQDVGYRDFQCKLIPGVDHDTVIGVRTPQLRRLAKSLSKTELASEFIRTLPHDYYDENNLHGLLIEDMKDFDAIIAALDAFLPYVDNWATCDIISPKVFKKHLPELLDCIEKWVASDHTYTVRFGVEMLMSFYLDDAFRHEYLELAANVRHGEYYIDMIRAWFFATALAKQYEATLPYIAERRLDAWTHNKAIQKAMESYRITPEQKEHLRTFKLAIKATQLPGAQ